MPKPIGGVEVGLPQFTSCSAVIESGRWFFAACNCEDVSTATFDKESSIVKRDLIVQTDG